MKKYHKIQSVFKRDMTQKQAPFILGEYTESEFQALRNNEWEWIEKIDGTNIRVHWDGSGVEIGGREENSSIPAALLKVLMERFTPEVMLAVFGSKGGISLYGEGYGKGIQKVGKLYLPDSVDFILFDIAGGDTWFTQQKVAEYASRLNIKSAPCVGYGTLSQAIQKVKQGFYSLVNSSAPAEGLILRPVMDLKTRLGERIITKIKTRDFKDASWEEIQRAMGE